MPLFRSAGPSADAFRKVQGSDIGQHQSQEPFDAAAHAPQSIYTRSEDICRDLKILK